MFGVFVNFRTVVISLRHIGRLFSLNGYLLKNGASDKSRTYNFFITNEVLYH